MYVCMFSATSTRRHIGNYTRASLPGIWLALHTKYSLKSYRKMFKTCLVFHGYVMIGKSTLDSYCTESNQVWISLYWRNQEAPINTRITKCYSLLLISVIDGKREWWTFSDLRSARRIGFTVQFIWVPCVQSSGTALTSYWVDRKNY